MDIIKQHYIIDMSSNNNFVQMSGMQGDGYQVRYAEIELIQNGERYIVDSDKVLVDIMGTKPDTKEIWNECSITDEGYVLVEITQQMLAVAGRGDYVINLIHKVNNRQLKSFPFILITIKAPYDPLYIESTDEFQRLVTVINDSMKYAEAAKESAAEAKTHKEEANDWSNMSQSYAVGTGGIIRSNDATDNSKYYSEVSHQHEQDSLNHSVDSKNYMDQSEDYSERSKSYAVGTNDSYRPNDSTDNAEYYCNLSHQYEQDSLSHSNDSKNYMDQSEDYSERSKSYAVGTNNTYRLNDDTDNSEYYSRISKNHADSATATLQDVIKAKDDAVKAITDAMDVATPDFQVDITNGHIYWQGGRFNFEVNSAGHLMWGMTI